MRHCVCAETVVMWEMKYTYSWCGLHAQIQTLYMLEQYNINDAMYNTDHIYTSKTYIRMVVVSHGAKAAFKPGPTQAIVMKN